MALHDLCAILIFVHGKCSIVDKYLSFHIKVMLVVIVVGNFLAM